VVQQHSYTNSLDRSANIPVQCKDGRALAFPGRFVLIRDGRDRPVGAMAVWSSCSGSEQPWTPVT
jgi:hypothetical protein